MKKTKLVILGASAFPEISDLVKDINSVNNVYEVIEILDDNETLHGSTIEGVKVGGPLDKSSGFSEEIKFVLAIGSYRTRIQKYYILKKL